MALSNGGQVGDGIKIGTKVPFLLILSYLCSHIANIPRAFNEIFYHYD